VVTGFSRVTLPGMAEPPSGNFDLFITKYNSTGQQLWIHRLAMPDADFSSGSFGRAWGDWTDVTVDRSGNAYVTGTTFSEGTALWGRSGANVLVASYDASGQRRWVRELESIGDDHGQGIALDGVGGVYVTGQTTGTLPAAPEANVGSSDMFIAKYTTPGDPQWVRQFGTPDEDRAFDIAIDRSLNLWLIGSTTGLLPGSHEHLTGLDVAVAKFDRTGALRWADQIGTRGADSGRAIALDPAGNPIITGDSSDAPLPGAPEGIYEQFGDIFVAKLNAHAPTHRWSQPG
jgi:hypothetical protein